MTESARQPADYRARGGGSLGAAAEADSARAPARWIRRTWNAARWPAAIYLLICLAMMMLENSLIFFPAKYPVGEWEPRGLVFEDAWFEAEDGARLHGWFCPVEHPRAVVLFAHGNAGNLSGRADTLRFFQDELRCSILIFDYRGFGRSNGEPDEAGVLRDARAARGWLAERCGIGEREIVLFGESIGGAVAIDLAAKDGARGVIVENTFTSLPDVAAYHYPWLPVRWLMRSRLDSLSKIERYHGPLLICHGDADTIVPTEHSRKLFARANEPKRLVLAPGGDHNDPRTPDCAQAIGEFIEGLE